MSPQSPQGKVQRTAEVAAGVQRPPEVPHRHPEVRRGYQGGGFLGVQAVHGPPVMPPWDGMFQEPAGTGVPSSPTAMAGPRGTPTRCPRSRCGVPQPRLFPPAAPATSPGHGPRPSTTWTSSTCLTRGWPGRSCPTSLSLPHPPLPLPPAPGDAFPSEEGTGVGQSGFAGRTHLPGSCASQSLHWERPPASTEHPMGVGLQDGQLILPQFPQSLHWEHPPVLQTEHPVGGGQQDGQKGAAHPAPVPPVPTLGEHT